MDIQQMSLFTYTVRNRRGNIAGIIHECGIHDLAIIFLIKALRFGIHGHDSFEIQKIFFILLVKNFIIRMNHLFSDVIRSYVARKNNPGSFFENTQEIRHLPFKPLRGQIGRAVADHRFQDFFSSVIAILTADHVAHSRLDFFGFETVDFSDFPAVFISPRQKEKQIFHGGDFFIGEAGRHFRAHTFQILNRQIQFFQGFF